MSTAASIQPDKIVFEPYVAGGGSLWTGDSLLATLTVSRLPQRQGRLSIRSSDRAFDITATPNGGQHSHRLLAGVRQAGSAEWIEGQGPVRLSYQGQTYRLDPDGLFLGGTGNEPVATWAKPDWYGKQLVLHLARELDLELIGFALFVLYEIPLGRGVDQSTRTARPERISE